MYPRSTVFGTLLYVRILYFIIKEMTYFLYARLETGPYYVIGYGGRASTQVSAQ